MQQFQPIRIVCRECGIVCTETTCPLGKKSECICLDCKPSLMLQQCEYCGKCHPKLSVNKARDKVNICWKCNICLRRFGKPRYCKICNLQGAFGSINYCLHCHNLITIYERKVVKCECCSEMRLLLKNEICYQCHSSNKLNKYLELNPCKKQKIA